MAVHKFNLLFKLECQLLLPVEYCIKLMRSTELTGTSYRDMMRKDLTKFRVWIDGKERL